jgi:hypothetical protein
MNTIKIGRTIYKLRDTSTIFADHAKCTGKHKKIKPKADKPRQYPAHGANMSTADYVAAYRSANSSRCILDWDWQPLTEHVSVPQGFDAYEVDA